MKKIKNALISAYNKDGLTELIKILNEQGVSIYSTGGTEDFIKSMSIPVLKVENLTGYPSILSGRVKTLHPKVFGGILSRRHVIEDKKQLQQYDIPEFDLVIVDLYPFEATVQSGASADDIIEKIDIGGISLIRAAAKNFKDVAIISSKDDYDYFLDIIKENNGCTTEHQRKNLALKAFNISSHYDTSIFNYFNANTEHSTQLAFKQSILKASVLRYGENPHQKGTFFGNFDEMFEKHNGKELSYNNLVDIDSAIALIEEFTTPTFAIIKHTNACGVASRATLSEAWDEALACDPVSAFGGVIVCNKKLDFETASKINQLFFEVLIAPGYELDALTVLCQKKNRIILTQKPIQLSNKQFKTLLNGVVEQEKDSTIENEEQMQPVTIIKPTSKEFNDLFFANKIVKHTKSNTIVLVKNNQLVASGVGQTSRIDALQQAITKAKTFGFDLNGAVMASDAFFPFPDCVNIAAQVGITAILQPGGSIKDQDSINEANKHQIAMVFTGIRHFKH